MRRFILSALLLSSATPLLAQVPPPGQPGYNRELRDDRRELRDDRQELRQDRRDGDRAEFRDDRRELRDDRREFRDDRRDVRDDRRDWRDDRRDDRRDWRDDRRDARSDWRDDRRGYGPGDRFARYRGEAFSYPRGYGYRYYQPGVRIPRVYFDSRYYIGRPDFYRLPPAYGGTRWLRIGPDALLIRAYDGQVVRVIRGLFY